MRLVDFGRTTPTDGRESIWNSPLSHYDQLKNGVGMGVLQRENDLGKLRDIFEYGISHPFRRNRIKRKLLLSTYDLARRLHEGQDRRRDDSEVMTHLAKVAIMGLRNKNINVLSVAVRLLHDSIEDGRTTRDQLLTELKGLGYKKRSAEAIVDGVEAMSMIDGGRKLSYEEYDEKLVAMDSNRPYLFLLETKKDDRANNTNSDIVMMLDHPERANFVRIADYRTGKAQDALNLAFEATNMTESHQRLSDAITTCQRIERDTKPTGLSSETTIYKAA